MKLRAKKSVKEKSSSLKLSESRDKSLLRCANRSLQSFKLNLLHRNLFRSKSFRDSRSKFWRLIKAQTRVSIHRSTWIIRKWCSMIFFQTQIRTLVRLLQWITMYLNNQDSVSLVGMAHHNKDRLARVTWSWILSKVLQTKVDKPVDSNPGRWAAYREWSRVWCSGQVGQNTVSNRGSTVLDKGQTPDQILQSTTCFSSVLASSNQTTTIRL